MANPGQEDTDGDGIGDACDDDPTAPPSDTTAPVVTVPADIAVEADSPQGSVVAYTASAVDDVDGPLVPSCSPPSGTTFALGATTVTCSATDAAGNTGSASFTVTVQDTTPPTLTVPAAVTVTTSSPAGSPASTPAIAAFLAGATAQDIADASPAIASAPALDPFPLGQTVVTFTATDDAGNQASQTSTVTVVYVPPDGAAPATAPVVQSAFLVDRKPPGDVRALRVVAGDHRVTLRWQRPPDPDFDHVVITRALRKTPALEGVVYRGSGTSFEDRRLKNGVQYRYRIVSVDRAGNESAGVAASALPKRVLLVAPKDGARLLSVPRFRWVPVPKASYYNIQLYRETARGAEPVVKILSAWPSFARFTLTGPWTFDGRLQRLRPGRYHWYVWPGFGPRVKARYGLLLGQSTFVILP